MVRVAPGTVSRSHGNGSDQRMFARFGWPEENAAIESCSQRGSERSRILATDFYCASDGWFLPVACNCTSNVWIAAELVVTSRCYYIGTKILASASFLYSVGACGNRPSSEAIPVNRANHNLRRGLLAVAAYHIT